MDSLYPKSPYIQVGGIVYFARMLDKIRLQAIGKLSEDYIPNLGKAFDLRCCKLLGVEYDDVVEQVHEGSSDEEVLEWCFEQAGAPDEERIEVWNGFMVKRGWKDEATETLKRRLYERGCENRTDIETMFDFLDLDEDRDPALRA